MRCIRLGVDLGSILEKKPTSLQELKGKRVAIDAFNTLYQFLTIIRQPDGTPLMDAQGRITSHLSGLFYRTCNLLEAGIKPVFVFDGEPSDLKKKTIAERVAAKMEAEEALKAALAAGRIEEEGRLAQRTARLNSQMIEESKLLLELMGVPCVQAPSEGEAQCAYMARQGMVDAAGSQDYDTLLFGAPVHLRNLTIAGRRKVAGRNIYTEVLPEQIFLEENLKRLGLTREQLVWIGMLAGTDFNEGIYGIGPKKALKLVAGKGDFSEIVDALGEKAQGFDWKAVEQLFLNPPVVEPEKTLRVGEMRRAELVELMCDEHGFSRERIEAAVSRAYKEPLDSSQNSLKKWF